MLPPLALLLALCAPPAAADEVVRVATWNLQTVGAPGDAEYEAVLAALGRIDADVVAVNEILGGTDAGYFSALAAEAGYDEVHSTSAPYGSHYNGFLSRLPIVSWTEHDAPALSGDASADDITRYPVELVVELPDGQELALVVEHWKSGSGDANEFRRAVEMSRVAQAVEQRSSATEHVVVMGDCNVQLSEVPGSPATFTSIPTGMPSGYALGADLAATLAGSGLPNNPFAILSAAVGLDPVDVLQLDGDDATYPSSGGRLDYVMVGATLAAGAAGTVYDSTDEGLSGGIGWAGSALATGTSAAASDHLPVVVDLVVPGVSSCGDAVCDADEDCSTCPDDCGTTWPAACGDGVCDASGGEDCLSCPSDCNGLAFGPVGARYCCGDGAGPNPTCEDARCKAGGKTCTLDPVSTCCGDGVCDLPEDAVDCPEDCEATPGCDGDGVCEAGEDCATCPSDCDALTTGAAFAQYCCGDGVRTGRERIDADCDGNW